jgi:hypothetical protein
MNSIIKIIDTFNLEVNNDDLAKQNIKLDEQNLLLPVNYTVATSWYFYEIFKKEVSLYFKITVIDAQGKKHDGPSQEHKLPIGIDRANINFGIQGLPIGGAGHYKLIAEIISTKGDNKVLATGEYPFRVNIIKNSPSPLK